MDFPVSVERLERHKLCATHMAIPMQYRDRPLIQCHACRGARIWFMAPLAAHDQNLAAGRIETLQSFRKKQRPALNGGASP